LLSSSEQHWRWKLDKNTNVLPTPKHPTTSPCRFVGMMMMTPMLPMSTPSPPSATPCPQTASMTGLPTVTSPQLLKNRFLALHPERLLTMPYDELHIGTMSFPDTIIEPNLDDATGDLIIQATHNDN